MELENADVKVVAKFLGCPIVEVAEQLASMSDKTKVYLNELFTKYSD